MRIAPIALGLLLIGCRPMDVSAPIDDTLTVRGTDRPGIRLAPLRVIDGDTFEMNGETVRIANIDTPERAPRAKCLAEAQLAEVAKRSLEEALGTTWGTNGVGIAPDLTREGQDRYGRTLARVSLTTGVAVGDLMIERGYAVRWSGRMADWCA